MMYDKEPQSQFRCCTKENSEQHFEKSIRRYKKLCVGLCVYMRVCVCLCFAKRGSSESILNSPHTPNPSLQFHKLPLGAGTSTLLVSFWLNRMQQQVRGSEKSNNDKLQYHLKKKHCTWPFTEYAWIIYASSVSSSQIGGGERGKGVTIC